MRPITKYVLTVIVVLSISLVGCNKSMDEVNALEVNTDEVETVDTEVDTEVDCVIPVAQETKEIKVIGTELISEYSSEVQECVEDYIYQVIEDKGYTKCEVPYVLECEDYIFLDILFNDVYYKGVYVNLNPVKLMVYYDTKLRMDYADYWEYN